MIVGIAVGIVGAITSKLLMNAHLRPDVAIGLVLGVPSTIGLLVVLFSGRRWVTTVGVFVLAIAPGWFGVVVATQVVSSA
jgi:hypothetical protein